MAVRLQLPAVWKREREWQSDYSSPPSGRERESGSHTAAPRRLEERESGSQTAAPRCLEERESGSQTAAPLCLDCQGSSITFLCDQNYTMSGQRAKEEGGGEISPPPLLSSTESEMVRPSDKETSVSTTLGLAREQRRKEEERSVLLHCQLSKTRDSRTVRQGDIGLHCPVSNRTDREGRGQKEWESAESRFSFTV